MYIIHCELGNTTCQYTMHITDRVEPLLSGNQWDLSFVHYNELSLSQRLLMSNAPTSIRNVESVRF